MTNPVFINLPDLIGVDDETFAAADRGDRQAQKVMMRKLLTKQASATALTTKSWTYWVLRGVATGSEEGMADALGSIAEAGRNALLTAQQTDALNQMYEQYFGPEEVGEPASSNVLAAFQGNSKKLSVIRLFLFADKLASGSPGITTKAITKAVSEAAALDSSSAQAFFNAVKAQYMAETAPQAAFEVALESVKTFSELAENDEIYKVKLGQTVFLAAQISEIAGQSQAGLLLRLAHAEAVEAFLASQQ